MVNPAALHVHLLTLAAIGVLPAAFFRRGEHHLRWWLTALPFFVCGGTLVSGALGVLDRWLAAGAVAEALEVLSVAGSLGAVALIGVTAGVHRVRLHLWHQDGDDPVEIVDWGPYRSIRHPFYAAFLLILTSSALFFPHPLTVLAAAHGAWVLNTTAAQEERRLLDSRFKDQYAAYLERTRRFVPALRGRAS
jgi:protein-S-isoprenylcysteine O-methyltransferase Ste14